MAFVLTIPVEFDLSTATNPGQATPGFVVTIPVEFDLSAPTTPPPPTPDTDPTPDPTPQSVDRTHRFADTIYNGLEGFKSVDAKNGFAYKTFLRAIGQMFEQVEQLARDDVENGHMGWSMLFDPDRIPAEGLPWLSQVVGSPLPRGISEDAARAYIKARPGMRRGTQAALVAAAQPHLKGTGAVIIQPRTPTPHSFTVVTANEETVDASALALALRRVKPFRERMVYGSVPVVNINHSWNTVKAGSTNWTEVLAEFATWTDLKENG